MTSVIVKMSVIFPKMVFANNIIANNIKFNLRRLGNYLQLMKNMHKSNSSEVLIKNCIFVNLRQFK